MWLYSKSKLFSGAQKENSQINQIEKNKTRKIKTNNEKPQSVLDGQPVSTTDATEKAEHRKIMKYHPLTKRLFMKNTFIPLVIGSSGNMGFIYACSLCSAKNPLFHSQV